MKVLESGSTYNIFPDDLIVKDILDVGIYVVRLNKQGFYLERANQFGNTEEKMYGNSQVKIDKIKRTYHVGTRSLGVLFSGTKGIGKTLCVANLTKQLRDDSNLPTIIINTAFKGISDFIESIQQEVVVVLDEFEKVFIDTDDDDEGDSDSRETQSALLGLLDGASSQKRLYVLTVNSLSRVSEYLLGRTGRIHYHIKFDYPTTQAVTEYLKDNLKPKYHSQISQVLDFTSHIGVTYDTLRSIVFELNLGYPFEEALIDLNVDITGKERYDVEFILENGLVLSGTRRFSIFTLRTNSESIEDLLGGWLMDTLGGSYYLSSASSVTIGSIEQEDGETDVIECTDSLLIFDMTERAKYEITDEEKVKCIKVTKAVEKAISTKLN